jgi:hypothetical protein
LHHAGVLFPHAVVEDVFEFLNGHFESPKTPPGLPLSGEEFRRGHE